MIFVGLWRIIIENITHLRRGSEEDFYPCIFRVAHVTWYIMDMLFSVPYLVRILVSLGGILFFQKITKSLVCALAGGIFILALWTGHSGASMASITYERLFSLDSLFLSFIIAGVICLSSLMAEAGMMKDLVASLKSRLSRKNLLAVLPAVVGLLPMPAGAVFSAPLVDDADEGCSISPLSKARINYWFRHVWEFWWPLYPGVLLASDLAGLEIWKLAGIMMPLTAATIGAGYIFLFREVPRGELRPGTKDKAFLPLIIPTLTVIFVYGILLVTVPALSAINRYIPMAIGVVCGISVLQFQRPASAAVWKKVLSSRRTLSLLVIVILARIYGAFIEARLPGGVLLMEIIRSELSTFGIPVLFLVVIVPFVSGLTTGLTVGYIGASFPVVISLAGADTGGLLSAVILGYTCGFLGMTLSPIHICLIVTNEYFKTSLFQSLKGLLLPSALVFACAAAYSLVWSFFP